MMQLDLIDLCEAARRRDIGMAIAQANAPDYFAIAIAQIEQFRTYGRIMSSVTHCETFTFEDVIAALTPLIGAPPSKALPGTICMQAVKRGLIERTGEYWRAVDPGKHAHENKVYRWCR